jgi:hypothetical protein
MSACLMVSDFAARPTVNLRSQIAHWQCTKTQKLLDGIAPATVELGKEALPALSR